MGKRFFEVRLDGWAVVEIDDQVIDVVDDDWRAQLYPLHTAEQIAEHIAFNLVVRKWRLSHLDGWADQPDTNARIAEEFDADLTVREILESELLENQ